jgi:hypothetical protein
MSDEERVGQGGIDPGGNTEQWRVFAHGSDPVVPKKRPIGTIIVGAAIIVVIVGGLLFLAFM